jgi:predicted CxxxxCH...CXXCH cytochrome family protein
VRTPFTCLVLVVVALAACEQARTREVAPDCPSWTRDVAPLTAARCTGCHGGATPAAGYDLTTYLGAIARAIRPPDDATHAAVADTRALLDTWAGAACKLAYSDSPLHEGGLMNPADPDFHGQLLHDEGWDFALCQKCHGDDFAGGTSKKSCLGCHAEGPTACGTCHAKQPATKAHPAHTARFACSECHVVPARWDAPGHIRNPDGSVDEAPAEVTLGALAARDLTPPRRPGPPRYDPASGRCDNVYCHGGGWNDAAATHPSPVWTKVGQGQAACGSCHGQPPEGHGPSTACASCHPTRAEAHLDGAVEVGDGSGSCTACHGAPPASGAHRQHVFASALRGPIPCNECHLVPATVAAIGHIDSDLPAEVTFGALASARGAMPTWDTAAGRCAGTYCHGSATPVWTRLDQGEAACGTCHGVPPASPAHAPTLTLRDCHTCHAGSVDGFGNILTNGGHLDGNVDL